LYGKVFCAVAAVNAVLSPAHECLLRKAQIGWFGDFDVEGFYAGVADSSAAREL
jgi:hypothetical protein